MGPSYSSFCRATTVGHTLSFRRRSTSSDVGRSKELCLADLWCAGRCGRLCGRVRKKAAEMVEPPSITRRRPLIHQRQYPFCERLAKHPSMGSSHQIREYIVNILESDAEAAVPRTLTTPPAHFSSEIYGPGAPLTVECLGIQAAQRAICYHC